MTHSTRVDATDPVCCPWCLSMDPNKVGVEKATGKMCRDPFHCPTPDAHSANGGPFRMCPYCDWSEDEPCECGICVESDRRELALLRAVVARVEALHKPDPRDRSVCMSCIGQWPCATSEALAGDE